MKKYKNPNYKMYYINIDDVQNVADDVLDRQLDETELEIVDRYIGDYIDWFGAIEEVIENKIIKNND